MNGLFSIKKMLDNPIDELHHFSRWLKPPTSSATMEENGWFVWGG
jgi:hypothetical protein